MKTVIVIFLFSIIVSKGAEIGTSLTGFVRYDAIYDSRQSARLRENSIMLYPLPKKDDGHGNDVNAAPTMNMFTLHTRLAVNLFGPRAFGAMTSGKIEGEFFGGTDDDVNGFRLRHAYFLIEWEKTHILVGQYWNPMFIVGVLPTFNFASPFIPYGRRPQVKIDYHLGDFNLIACASMQSDFKSIGPDVDGKPIRSTVFNKNAGIPSFNYTSQYSIKGFTCGVGVDYKKLIPKLMNDSGATRNSIESLALNMFLRKDYGELSLKMQGVIGENLSDMVMLGGFALKENNPQEYTNTKVASGWGEVSFGRELKFAVFGGYTQNLGSVEKAVVDGSRIYSMGWDIKDIIRIAPSLQLTSGSVQIIGELDYTVASYGNDFDKFLKPIGETTTYENFRINLTGYYFF